MSTPHFDGSVRPLAATLRRGQATVETVLFLCVFLTAVFFGLHFAELTTLSVRAQEGAASAIWDATAARHHDIFSGDFTPVQEAISRAGPDATARYRDFDGLTERGRAPVEVFTRAEPLEVRCEVVAVSGVAPVEPTSSAIAAVPSGIACTSRAVISAFRFPRSFLQKTSGGFFQAEQRVRDYGVCAFGQNGTRCAGRVVALLDDWGYSGARERLECPLAFDGASGCTNRGYWQQVDKTYRTTVSSHGDGFGTASSALARNVVGRSVLEETSGDAENQLFLSFRSSDSQYTETLQQSHPAGATRWETTPFQSRTEFEVIATHRDDCWLGTRCQ